MDAEAITSSDSEIEKQALVDPSLDQVLHSSHEVISHWLLSNLENEEYIPDPNVIKAMICDYVDYSRDRAFQHHPEVIEEEWEWHTEGLNEEEIEWNKQYYLEMALEVREAQQWIKRAGTAEQLLDVKEPESEQQKEIYSDWAQQQETLGTPDFTDVDETEYLYADLCQRLIHRLPPQQQSDIAQWVAKNYGNLGPYVDSDVLFYMVFKGVNQRHPDALGVGTAMVEIVGHIEQSNKSRSDKNYDEHDLIGHWAHLGDRYFLFFRGILASSNVESAKFAARAAIENPGGLPKFIDGIRELLASPQLQAEYSGAKKWVKELWTNSIPYNERQTVQQNIINFYNAVKRESHSMTEEREGERRIKFLSALFKKEGITPSDSIHELACGNGWLTHGLRELGYKVFGSDINPSLISEARAKYGRFFETKSWFDVKKVKTPPRAIIVNGRSIHHLKNDDDIGKFISSVSKADLIVFDALNPLTGRQAELLQATRDTLAKLHFDRDKLETDYWDILGSVDGVNLGNRYAPPKETWIAHFESRGYAMEVFSEPNYDGQGTENMVFVARRVAEDPMEVFWREGYWKSPNS